MAAGGSGLSAVRGLNDVGAAQIAELLEVALTRQTAALQRRWFDKEEDVKKW